MKLYIKDRIFIPQMLPQHGNLMEFSCKKEILKQIAITAEDKEKYSIVENPAENKITWDITKDLEEPIEINFTSQQIEYIRKGIEAIADKNMPDEFWAVAERIYEINDL